MANIYPLFNIYPPKIPEIRISKSYVHIRVHCSSIYNGQDVETNQASINRWMDKEDMVDIYKKERNSTICDNMDEPGKKPQPHFPNIF